jgi:hypothetical protein
MPLGLWLLPKDMAITTRWQRFQNLVQSEKGKNVYREARGQLPGQGYLSYSKL